MALSVIVPTIEKFDEDVICLDYLEQQSFDDYEVIIRRDEGAARARNEGVKRASSDKLVFLDDDSMPNKEYLEVASTALDEHPAVVGRVYQPEDAPITHLSLPWYDQGDATKQTRHVPGCNLAIRRDLFEKIGGFDETFHHGHEETELGRRLARDAYIQYVPEMVVYHYFAGSLRKYWLKMYRHGKADLDLWEVEGVPFRRQVRRILFPNVYSIHLYDLVGLLFQGAGRVHGLLERL